MTDTRLLSNQNVTVWIGPDNGIADYTNPQITEINALTNASGAIRWNGFTFNLAASLTDVDTSLTDAAGSKTRSYTQFKGPIAFFTPKPGVTDLLRTVRNIVKAPRTRLAVAIRVGKSNALPAVAGDVINVFRVITDANTHQRGKSSFAYTIDFVPQGDNGVRCILPVASPTAVTLTPATLSLSLAAGAIGYLKGAYQGNNVTIGATYSTSASAIATVTPHGIVIPVAVGTANITAIYPGSLVSTACAVTVTT